MTARNGDVRETANDAGNSDGPGSPTDAPTADFRALIAGVRPRVDARLREWLEPRVMAASQVSTEAGIAASAVRELSLRGGKRMRAALVAAGFEARTRGAQSWSACESAMLAVELLQTYLLIHDDWMDGDEVRRGGPAVHVRLREELGGQELGDAVAIIAGDLACAYAQETLLESDFDPALVLRAARVFARMQVEVTMGQIADMCTASSASGRVCDHPSVEEVYALKTASYTVTGPLLVGAALADIDDAGAAELERFGRPLGIAFQLRDDLLGVFGDSSATGKPVGSDLRQGKRTALVTGLRGDAHGEALLERVYGRAAATSEDVAALVQWMKESGARARVEARIRELCTEAWRALDAMAPWITDRGRAWLAGAVTTLGERAS